MNVLTRLRLERDGLTESERSLADVENAVRSRFGRRAVFRGTSLRPCATGLARSAQVGGHHE
mgnify:CR=1 FL=1